MHPDTRFEHQRNNLLKALQALERSVEVPVEEPRDLSGIIKDFEIVYELSWKALKTYLELLGHEAKSARDTFAIGYQLSYLQDQDVWMDMISDRNLTVHTYDERFAEAMVERIKTLYVPAFQTLKSLFTETT